MKTGAKIGIAAGVAALSGGLGYFIIRSTKKQPAVEPTAAATPPVVDTVPSLPAPTLAPPTNKPKPFIPTIMTMPTIVIPPSQTKKNIYNGNESAHLAVKITGTDTAAQKFTTISKFNAIDVSTPSWNNNIGSLTLTLYKWNTNYATTVGSSPIYSKRFVDFVDNTYLKLDFDDQNQGTYLWVLSNPTETVGVWKITDSTNPSGAYFNGSPTTGDYQSRYYGFEMSDFSGNTTTKTDFFTGK